MWRSINFIDGCFFTHNTAKFGCGEGGGLIINVSLTHSYCNFTNNTALYYEAYTPGQKNEAINCQNNSNFWGKVRRKIKLSYTASHYSNRKYMKYCFANLSVEIKER